jgi:hypothetical protein
MLSLITSEDIPTGLSVDLQLRSSVARWSDEDVEVLFLGESVL